MKKVKVGAVNCSLDDLVFPVEIRDEEMQSNKEYSKRIVGQINGGDFLLNQCSNIYKLFKNEDIFPTIEKILKAHDIEFRVTYYHINHVRFYADYIITDSRYTYTMKGTSDVICPMLSVQHSYNGLTKYRIVFGYWRMVCTNGLTIPVEEMKQFNLFIVGKHTEQIKNSFHKLDEMLLYFTENAEMVKRATTSKFEDMGGTWVANPKDRIIEVLNATKINMVDNQNFNTVNSILNRINAEATLNGLGYNGRVNDWLVYNGINQYLFDNRNITAPEVRKEADSKVLEYMIKHPYNEKSRVTV